MAWWLTSFPPWVKAVLVVGGGVLIGISTYGVLVYLEKKQQRFQDEGFEDETQAEEQQAEKKVVVLGLDGSGKSSFLANLSKVVDADNKDTKPTEGFHVMSLHTQDTSVNIWEIGGSENFRSYWGNFLQDTDALVFIVDSTDVKRLPQAYDEFKKLLTDERLKDVPILVLANKQDSPEALTAMQVEEALSLKNLPPKTHMIKVMPIQILASKPQHPSVKNAEDIMIKLAFGK